MKKYFSLLLAMLLGSMATAVAQSTMCVNKTDGTKVIISIAEIEDIVFPDDNALQVDMPYQRYCLYLDQWVQLTATCSRDGEEVLAIPAWESNDPAVATVDGDGKVTAVGPGECDIICRCEGGEARLTLTVFEDKQFDMEIYNLKTARAVIASRPSTPVSATTTTSVCRAASTAWSLWTNTAARSRISTTSPWTGGTSWSANMVA